MSPRPRAAFAALLVAEAVSVTGTRMSMAALPWFVLTTTGSAARTGAVAFAEMLPYVVLTVLAAPVTDRVGARRTSIVCDAASLAVVAAVPLLHAAGALGFPLLLALVAVAGALRGPGDSAKYVLMPALADRAGIPLERAAAMYDGVSRVAGLVGAPIAGVLIAFIGAAQVLLVDAVTFAVAAALLAVAVPRAARATADVDEDTGVPYAVRLRTGFRFLVADRLLLAIGGMLFVTNLLDQAFAAVLVPLWSQENGHGAVGVGLISGAFGLGATLGTMAMVAVGPRLPRRLTFLVAFAICGSPRMFVAALDVPLAVLLAVVVVGGLAAGALNPIMTAVEMERIPERMRARVIGAMTAVAWGGIPLGGAVGGWLGSTLGASGALVVCGAVYLVATAAPLGRTWRAMDRRRPPVNVPA